PPRVFAVFAAAGVNISAASNSPALQKNRCEIRSTSRASPRSAQDDARERTAYISTACLSIESPAVFAVLFEAAKVKFPQCNSRVRFSQMISSFGGSTRNGGDMGGLPHARFLVNFWGAPKMNNKPTNNRNLCSHHLNSRKFRLLIRHGYRLNIMAFPMLPL
ncbi:MAG: hypothetical protein IJY66_04490, partial [Clostridia bacterium]|nr:hypothetical protein [Clostridia bacterium]